MDQAAMETAKLLGTGPVQLVLAIGLVFFVIVTLWLGKRLLAQQQECHAQTLDITIKKIESDNRLADALEGLERVIEAIKR